MSLGPKDEVVRFFLKVSHTFELHSHEIEAAREFLNCDASLQSDLKDTDRNRIKLPLHSSYKGIRLLQGGNSCGRPCDMRPG